MLLQPVRLATNAEHVTADAWNADLRSLVENNYPSAILVDVAPYIGVFRTGGPAGNLWDYAPGYDTGDHAHVNPAGKERVAQALYDAIAARDAIGYLFGPSSRTVTISGSDVTGVNFTGSPTT